jgi:hypothetical protein
MCEKKLNRLTIDVLAELARVGPCCSWSWPTPRGAELAAKEDHRAHWRETLTRPRPPHILGVASPPAEGYD